MLYVFFFNGTGATGIYTLSLHEALPVLILYDDHKLIRMKFYLNAVLDGWFGRFDNKKPRKITSMVS